MGVRKNISGHDVVAGIGHVEFKYSTANQDASSTTLVNSTHLVMPLEANSVYYYRAWIIYSASTVGDFNWCHSVPSGATMKWGDATNFYAPTAGTLDTWSGMGKTTAGIRSFGLDGIIRTSSTAGNMVGRFSQAASDPEVSTIHQDSWMRIERMA